MKEAKERVAKKQAYLGTKEDWSTSKRNWWECQVCKEKMFISHRYIGDKVRLRCTCGFSFVIEKGKL